MSTANIATDSHEIEIVTAIGGTTVMIPGRARVGSVKVEAMASLGNLSGSAYASHQLVADGDPLDDEQHVATVLTGGHGTTWHLESNPTAI